MAIAEEEFRRLKERFLYLAVHRSAEKLVAEFQALSYEPYAPVKSQYLRLLRLVNRRRRAARYEPVPRGALRLFRRSVPPFGVPGALADTQEAAACPARPGGSVPAGGDL